MHRKYANLREMATELELAVNRDNGSTAVELTLFSSYFQSVTVVEVPGLTNTDPAELNKLREYVSPPNTLILVVFAADQDLQHSQVLSTIQKEDPDGSRTIGVLTKTENVDVEAQATIDTILNNKGFISNWVGLSLLIDNK